MVSEQAFDPFSVKGVLTIPELPRMWDQLEFFSQTEYLHLSDLEKTGLGPLQTDLLNLEIQDDELEDISSSGSISTSTETPGSKEVSLTGNSPIEPDIWNVKDLPSKQICGNALTWDCFRYDAEPQGQDRKYITDATPSEYKDFQSALRSGQKLRPIHEAQNGSFQRALSDLMFGRASAFFTWNSEILQFDLTVHDFAAHGCSQTATFNLCRQIANFGSCFRRIHDYCQHTSRSSPTRYAFQRALQRLLDCLEIHVTGHPDQFIRFSSIAGAVEKMDELLQPLEKLVDLSASLITDSRFLLLAMMMFDDASTSSDHLTPIFATVASDTFEPAVIQTQQMIGYQLQANFPDDGNKWLLADLLPELVDTVHQVESCLTVIRNSSSDSVLPVNGLHVPNGLAHSWEDVAALHDTASSALTAKVAQQANLRKDKGAYKTAHVSVRQDSTDFDPFSIDFDAIGSVPFAIDSKTSINERPGTSMITNIAQLFSIETTNRAFEPSPIQALRISLQPIIELQHRQTSCILLKLLFLEQDLKVHLDMLNIFFLVGNGSFATRLVTALFDSEQDNYEGRRKSGLNGGLRLEDREAWPPASSELRLVLNSLLTDTVSLDNARNVVDCFSFAIKDMSSEATELCRNVHSIHALDFLRIVYTPADDMLETIITAAVLEKYDRIFNFMLILLRVHNLTQNLVVRAVKARTSASGFLYNRLCVEANHFITVFITYALRSAIGVPWQSFEGHLQSIRKFVEEDDLDKLLNTAKSVSQLQQDHDDTLEDMMKSLLLKKRHVAAFDAICDIFNLILQFPSEATIDSEVSDVRSAYKKFSQLRRDWYEVVKDICYSDGDPVLHRLQILLQHMDLSGTLGLWPKA